MMFEPGLTKGMLEVFVAPSHHAHCSADDQSTKAIDIQNAYLNGTSRPTAKRKDFKHSLARALGDSPEGTCPHGQHPSPTTDRGRASAVTLAVAQSGSRAG